MFSILKRGHNLGPVKNIRICKSQWLVNWMKRRSAFNLQFWRVNNGALHRPTTYSQDLTSVDRQDLYLRGEFALIQTIEKSSTFSRNSDAFFLYNLQDASLLLNSNSRSINKCEPHQNSHPSSKNWRGEQTVLKFFLSIHSINLYWQCFIRVFVNPLATGNTLLCGWSHVIVTSLCSVHVSAAVIVILFK